VNLLECAFSFIDDVFQEFGHVKISDDAGQVVNMLNLQSDPKIVKVLKKHLFEKQMIILKQYWFKF